VKVKPKLSKLALSLVSAYKATKTPDMLEAQQKRKKRREAALSNLSVQEDISKQSR
jgi:hypothetical protein